MKKWLLFALVCTTPAFGMSVGKATAMAGKATAKVTYRASKNLVLLPYRALKPAAKYLYRAGDGSPIPTCIPGKPCNEDEFNKA